MDSMEHYSLSLRGILGISGMGKPIILAFLFMVVTVFFCDMQFMFCMGS
jgi:hypothetical protein